MRKTRMRCFLTIAALCVAAPCIDAALRESNPPTVIAARIDYANLTLVTLTFSTEVVDAADAYVYYLQDIGDPNHNIAVIDASYGASSNVIVLALADPRDATRDYHLNIIFHNIQDRDGNPLPDPTIIRITVPATFQNGANGYDGTRDTSAEQSAPDANHGNDPTVHCDDSPRSQGLLRFDNFIGGGPGQVPIGAWITHATLRLYTTDRSAENTPIRVLRMLASWEELTATWNSLTNGIDQTNGVETGVSDALVTAATNNSFVEFVVTAAVQAWVSGEPNYGWAFLATGPDGWRWASSENGSSEHRPALMIDYWYEPSLCEIVEHPRSLTVAEGESFMLSVLSRGSSLQYQWFKNGVSITNANASSYTVARSRPSDSGNYYVRVYNDWTECISAIATITICCPPDPPYLLSSIGNSDQTTIALRFSNTLDPVSASDPANYTISGGLNIVGVSHMGMDVKLTNGGPRLFGRNYTLTIQNVRGDYAAANLIYPNPTIVTLTQDVRVLSFDTVWRYENSGADLGILWKSLQFDDSMWLSGPGLLGFETTQATLSALSNQNVFVGTTLSLTNQITDYFRTMVNVPFYAPSASYTIRHVTDDGAVFYFNGTEAARFNMPQGPIDYLTRAITAPGEGVVRSITNVAGLFCGWNLLAVELHQQSETSADVLFGAEIIARVPEFTGLSCEGGLLSIVLNTDRTISVYWPANTILQQTDDLGGHWTNTPAPTNPLHIPAPTGSRFYRLRAF